MIKFEEARAALTRLIDEAKTLGDEVNEATVRFRLIDELVTEVFGWEKASVAVERYDRGDYTDYECGSPAKLIIEAKRASTHFTVPAGFKEPMCAIKTLANSSSEVAKALEQALDYCRQRGVPFGAICNGKQLALFMGSRTDAVSPMDGQAAVFLSLEDISERFEELWNMVSPPGLIEGHLSRLLRRQALPAPPLKLSRRIIGYPGYKNRNPTAAELQILGGLFIEDLSSNKGTEEYFLQQTYCQSGALSQYAMVSKELLRTRYTAFFEKQTGVTVVPATNKHGTSNELTSDIIAASLSRRPILLVGDVGAGKTTFVRNLIKVDAKDELKRAIVLYIDFGSKPAVVDELNTYALTEIVRQLRANYDLDIWDRFFVRGVHNQRIQDFSKGIYGELKDIDPTAYKIKEIDFIEELGIV